MVIFFNVLIRNKIEPEKISEFDFFQELISESNSTQANVIKKLKEDLLTN